MEYREKIFRSVCKIVESDCWVRHGRLSIRPAVCMLQIGSHWNDFHEIWYFSIFRNYVQKIQVSLKYDKNKEYFTWRPIYDYDYISLSSS